MAGASPETATRGARALAGSVVRDVRRFDHAAFAPGAALRITAGVTAMLAIGLGTSNRGAAASMAVGAFLTGVASRASSGARRPPVATMAGTTLGMALATFLGSVTGHLPWFHLALLAFVGGIGGLLVALGDAGGTIGTQAVVALVVFGRYPTSAAVALELAGYVAAGGAAQTLIAALLRWPPAPTRHRLLLAAAYRELAGLAGAIDQGSGIGAAALLDDVTGELVAPGLLGRPDVERFQVLVDLGRRIRMELLVLSSLRRQLLRQTGDGSHALLARLDELGVLAAFALRAIAEVLEQDAPATTEAYDAAARALARWSGSHRDVVVDAIIASATEHVAALGGQLRGALGAARAAHAGRRIGAPRLGARPRELVAVLGTDLETLRANLTLTSAAARHALRLALVVPLASLLAEHSPLERGYWVALTVALVLRPDFSATYTRGVARVVGTIAGVGLASLAVLAVAPGSFGSLVLIAAFTWAAAAVFKANYAAFSGFVTGLVVLLISLVTPSTLATAGARLVDTVLGGAMALAAYGLWPTWSRAAAEQALGDLVRAQRAYLAAVLETVADARARDDGRLRALAKHARLVRSNAEATVARSLAEPHHRRIDPTEAAAVLAGLRRVSTATHAIRSDAVAGRLPPELAALDPLARGFDGALGQIAAALDWGGESGPPGALPRLRQLHDELVEAIRGAPGALVLPETDELVDALDTIAQVIADRRGARGSAPGERV